MPIYLPNKILYFESELQLMASYVLASPACETGGDLFGLWSHTGCPVLQRSLGPGEEARMDAHSFFQDGRFLRQSGEYLIRNYGLQHIGQWHSHHQLDLMEPSDHDDETVCKAMQVYGLSRFLLCLFNILDAQTLNLNAYIYEEALGRRVLPWVRLAEPLSPYRKLRLEGESEPPEISMSGIEIKMPRASVDAPLYERLEWDGNHWFMQRWGQDFMRRLSQWAESVSIPLRWSLAEDRTLCLYWGDQRLRLSGEARRDFERFKALADRVSAVEMSEFNAILSSFKSSLR